MKYRVQGDTVHFTGNLNELVAPELLVQALREVVQANLGECIRMDFSEVQRANSLGLRSWVNAINEIEFEGWYVRAPTWLVRQVNMIDNFFKKGSLLIESFYAEFCETDTGELHQVLLHVGKEVPLQEDYAEFEFEPLSEVENAESWEPDFDQEEYLEFISENLEAYSDRLSRLTRASA